VEKFVDDKREKCNYGLIVSLDMIMNSGYNMTPKEFDILATKAGFKKTEYFNNGVEFALAYK
jgi:hypothetical protein